MGEPLVARIYFPAHSVVLGDPVIASSERFGAHEGKITVKGVIVDPVGDIDPAESVEKFGIPELAGRKKSALYKRGIGLAAILFGARKGDDMGGTLLLADPAVEDSGGAAVSAEACRGDVGRHDLTAALRACENSDAENVIFLRVLGLLVFVGIELGLAVIAHQLLGGDVKAQIPCAVGAIIHDPHFLPRSLTGRPRFQIFIIFTVYVTIRYNIIS